MKSIALYIKKKSIFIGLKFCKIDFYVQIIFDLVLPLKNGKTLACPFNCCLNPPKRMINWIQNTGSIHSCRKGLFPCLSSIFFPS